MTLEEIQSAVNSGKTVHWANDGYRVVPDGFGDHLIKCDHNGHCIGLTWKDGITINGKPEDFFLSGESNNDS